MNMRQVARLKLFVNFYSTYSHNVRKLKQVAVVFGILFIIFPESFSQGKFSFGGGGGIMTPTYSYSKEDKKAAFSHLVTMGYSFSALSQYTFNDQFGLETGVSIRVLNYKIKSDDLPGKSEILADSYAMPFLFLYRSSLRSNPYIGFELLAGPVVDFPSYIPIMGDERNDVLYLNREKVMLSIQSGVRLNFRDRRLNGLGAGLAYFHRLKPAFEFHPVERISS